MTPLNKPVPHKQAKAAERRLIAKQRKALTKRILNDRPWCEIRWPNYCTRWAEHLHERWSRAQGGPILELPEPIDGYWQRVADFNEWQFVASCDPCNGALEIHTGEAKAEGWKMSRWDVLRLFEDVVPYMRECGALK